MPSGEEPEPQNETDDKEEEQQLEPVEDLEAEGPQESIPVEEELLGLDEAVRQIPAALKEEMQELLRAEFREVIRWKDSSS